MRQWPDHRLSAEAWQITKARAERGLIVPASGHPKQPRLLLQEGRQVSSRLSMLIKSHTIRYQTARTCTDSLEPLQHLESAGQASRSLEPFLPSYVAQLGALLFHKAIERLESTVREQVQETESELNSYSSHLCLRVSENHFNSGCFLPQHCSRVWEFEKIQRVFRLVSKGFWVDGSKCTSAPFGLQHEASLLDCIRSDWREG